MCRYAFDAIRRLDFETFSDHVWNATAPATL
jgi:hypothetical protein